MPNRWTTATRRSSAKEQHATCQTQALAECQKGRHCLSNTFRPSEQICLICGCVFYCPACLRQSHLDPVPNGRAFALECPAHQTTTREVQA